MPTSLVTGGAGFIGSHIVEALLARGDNVRVLDNLSTGKLENLVDVLDRIEFIQGDLLDPEITWKAITGVDLVYHQAAFVSVPGSLEDPELCLEVNLRGTQQLLGLARRADVQRVVLASSAAVYGENPNLPLVESAQTDPLSPYASTKLITEELARMYTRQLGLDVVALRYFNVFGPRQNPFSDYAAVIPLFIDKLTGEGQPTIFGDGKQSRDFIYAADVARANLLASEATEAPGQVINICSGKEVNLLAMLEILGRIYNRPVEPIFDSPRAGDIYRSLGDPSLAAKLLGFHPQTSLQDGLEATASWMMGS